MRIRWNKTTDSYEFDTGQILGTIGPFGWYHGVTGMMHRSGPINLVRPENSFLNVEYYIRPGAGRKMLPRKISGDRRTTHKLLYDSAALHFPPEEEYALSLDLRYSIQDDAVDMVLTVTPGIDVPVFETFFASYVCEALRETWVPLGSNDGLREWVKLCNRGRLNAVFSIMRDASLFGLLPAEYPDLPVDVQDRPFSEPILIARDSTSGLALIFLCDPHLTKYLSGQYHGWDTAHDWSFGVALEAGQEIKAHSRLICRPFSSAEQMCESVIELWHEFRAEIHGQPSARGDAEGRARQP